MWYNCICINIAVILGSIARGAIARSYICATLSVASLSRRLPELPRVATQFLPNRIHYFQPDSDQLLDALAPLWRKMAAVSKVFTHCCGKVPGTILW